MLQRVFIPLWVSDIGEGGRAMQSTSLFIHTFPSPPLRCNLAVENWKGVDAEWLQNSALSGRQYKMLVSDFFLLEAHLDPSLL